jgi:hypothetical protein
MAEKKIDVLTIIEIVVVVAFIGAAVYFLFIRPRLMAVTPVVKSIQFAQPLFIKNINTVKVHSFLDYLNQIIGIAGGIIGVLVGLNSLRRNKKKSKS